MKTKNVLYITYIDFNKESKSGSSVRPNRMYETFIELGYKVKLIQGEGNKRNSRIKAVSDAEQWLNFNRPDFCYIEPSSGPIFFNCDRKLIKKIHKLNIPIGYFYRDLYWKFDSKLFTNNTPNYKDHIKSLIIRNMQKRDLNIIRNNIDVVYFPTKYVNSFMKLDKFEVLPPGCIDRKVEHKDSGVINAIYVGAATERYGIGLLLDSWIEILKTEKIELTIVTPEDQWKEYQTKKNKYFDLPEEISIYHISDGEEMKQLYNKADFAIAPLQKNDYSDLSMPIKLFEYLSYKLPVVVTNCTAMAEFTNNNNIGLIAKDNSTDLIKTIKEMASLLREKEFKKFDMQKACKDNLWAVRIKKLDRDMEIRNNKNTRIFQGLSEVAGQLYYSTLGLKKAGATVQQTVWAPNSFGYEYGYSLNIDRKNKLLLPSYVFKILAYERKIIKDYDVFHFHFGRSLMFNYDLRLLQRLNKKVFFEFHGSDVRDYTYTHELNKYMDARQGDYKRLNARTKKICKNANGIVLHDNELIDYFPEERPPIFVVPLRMDLSLAEPVYVHDEPDVLKIVHAPTNREIKGSNYIIKACDNLKKKYPIELILVENKTQREALNIYKSADIIIDQLKLGAYGVFAIESMAMGKPVIVYITEKMKEVYPEDLPVFSANSENIEEKLEELILNRSLRNRLSKSGPVYVQKYHNYEKNAKMLLDIYQGKLGEITGRAAFSYAASINLERENNDGY